jgi:hypothetical protein
MSISKIGSSILRSSAPILPTALALPSPFNLIGAVAGYISGYSKDKSDVLTSILQQQVQQVGQATASASTTANITAARNERVINKAVTAITERTIVPVPAAALRQGPFGHTRWQNENDPERTAGESVLRPANENVSVAILKLRRGRVRAASYADARRPHGRGCAEARSDTCRRRGGLQPPDGNRG